jgi:hypothetical protein
LTQPYKYPIRKQHRDSFSVLLSPPITNHQSPTKRNFTMGTLAQTLAAFGTGTGTDTDTDTDHQLGLTESDTDHQLGLTESDTDTDTDTDIDMIGHNSQNAVPDIEELENAAGKIISALLETEGAENKLDEIKAKGLGARQRAAAVAEPLFDRMGLDRAWGSDFAKRAKEVEGFNNLRELVCLGLAKKKKVSADISYKLDGSIKSFPGAINKQWSRLVSVYREGGDGVGGTTADKAGRERAKQKAERTRDMAAALTAILKHFSEEGMSEAVETQIMAAHIRFPAEG